MTDAATYEDPRALAVGIDDVFVNGARVLADGALTDVSAGRGLRRSGSAAALALEDPARGSDDTTSHDLR